MISESITVLLLIALVTASISFTITTTSIFKWFRELVSPLHKKIEELVHCPWCIAHYIALVILFILFDRTVFIEGIPLWVHFILNWFGLLAITGVLHYILLRAYEPVVKELVRREIQNLQKNKKEEED